MNFIHLAQKWNLWQVYMNTIINIQLTPKDGKFLTSQTKLTFQEVVNSIGLYIKGRKKWIELLQEMTV